MEQGFRAVGFWGYTGSLMLRSTIGKNIKRTGRINSSQKLQSMTWHSRVRALWHHNHPAAATQGLDNDLEICHRGIFSAAEFPKCFFGRYLSYSQTRRIPLSNPYST